jgi:hypothetical protein
MQTLTSYIIHLPIIPKCGWADLTSSIDQADQLGRAADKCWLMLLIRSVDSCYGYVSTETQSSTQFHGVGGWEKKQLWSQYGDASWVVLASVLGTRMFDCHGLSRFATVIAGYQLRFRQAVQWQLDQSLGRDWSRFNQGYSPVYKPSLTKVKMKTPNKAVNKLEVPAKGQYKLTEFEFVEFN